MRWLPALSLLTLAGCFIEVPPRYVPDAGDDGGPCGTLAAPNLTGRWVLSGTGERVGCVVRKYEGTVRLESAGVLEVAQDAVTPRVPNALRLAQPLAPVVFHGEVTGRCLRFDVEETVGAEVVRYEFTGMYEAASARVRGTFTGEGPSYCRTDGDFQLRVE